MAKWMYQTLLARPVVYSAHRPVCFSFTRRIFSVSSFFVNFRQVSSIDSFFAIHIRIKTFCVAEFFFVEIVNDIVAVGLSEMFYFVGRIEL